MSRDDPLPPYLQDIEAVLVDPEVADSRLALRVRERLPGREWRVADPDTLPADQHPRIQAHHDPESAQDQETILYLKHYKGSFLRFCPGTRQYRCCGYRIAHVGENCPIGCAYCILQAYFQDRVLKVWANQNDLFSELEKAFSADASMRYRIGTGEFTDSLVLEPITGYARDLVAFVSRFPNVRLELKSKTADISWLDAVHKPETILPAWSMNAPHIVDTFEGMAASLEERLASAKACAKQGLRVCLHFDPIIRFQGWQHGYAETIDMIFDHLRPEHIAYVSLGSFRFMPELKGVIQARHPKAAFIYEEFVTGLDNKQRLVRPLRVEQFRFIADKLRQGGLDQELYFCMESDQVWNAVLGRTVGDLPTKALDTHLLDLAFQDPTA